MFSFFIAPSSRQPLVLSHVTRHSILEYWFASRDFPMPTQRRQTWKDFPSGHRARNDTGRCLAAANHDLRAQCPVDFDTRFYSFFTFYFVSPIFSSDRNIIMRTATVAQPGPAMEKKALNARQLSSELESHFFFHIGCHPTFSRCACLLMSVVMEANHATSSKIFRVCLHQLTIEITYWRAPIVRMPSAGLQRSALSGQNSIFKNRKTTVRLK